MKKSEAKVNEHALRLPCAIGGVLTGFFGTGGGIPVVFSLEKAGVGRSKYRITLSLTVWLSVLSVLLLQKGQMPFASYLPMLLASVAGGSIGCRLLFSMQNAGVNRLFAGVLLLSGGLMIWRSLF